MGSIAKAVCGKCGYSSGGLYLEGGMMAVWMVADGFPYICLQCKEIKVIKVYHESASIEEQIREVKEKKECNYSSLTGDYKKVLKDLKHALKNSNIQEKDGLKCPDCSGGKIEPVSLDSRKPSKCPKCGEIAVTVEHAGLWD